MFILEAFNFNWEGSEDISYLASPGFSPLIVLVSWFAADPK